MSFTHRDFELLSPDRKLRKTLFALTQWENGEKEPVYFEEILSWLLLEPGFAPLGAYKDTFSLKKLLWEELKKLNPYLEEEPFDLEAIERKTLPLKLLLDDIRSPHNVGSIFRSGEALGVEEILLCGITPSPDRNKKVEKTARGSRVPFRYEKDAGQTAEELLGQGYHLYALEKHNKSIPLQSFTPKFPCVLILGNEEFGVSLPLLKLCEASLSISLFGAKNSLNVAVAAGIALSHFSLGLNF